MSDNKVVTTNKNETASAPKPVSQKGFRPAIPTLDEARNSILKGNTDIAKNLLGPVNRMIW